MNPEDEVKPVSIAVLEQELGIGKDTLRVWERRYGFPRPIRDARGERLYPADQVSRLREIRRLLDQGLRPGRVLTMTPEELSGHARTPPARDDGAGDAFVELLKRHDVGALRQELRTRLLREGLRAFCIGTAPALLALVGDAWARGEIEVYEEHLFSEQAQGVLHAALAQIPAVGIRPRVLLTTLPGESHGLGLLLAQVLLRLAGAHCTSLGTQTPESQIVAAVRADASDIVAVSFSENFPGPALQRAVPRLRGLLPDAAELWCGGSGAGRLKHPPEGVHCVTRLEEIEPLLEAWRERHG